MHTSQRPKTAGAYTGFPWHKACLGVPGGGGGGILGLMFATPL